MEEEKVHLHHMPKRCPVDGTFELTVRCNLHCKMCLFRHKDSENPLLDVLITATEFEPSNFIVVQDGLRLFFAPGFVNHEVDKVQTLKIPLTYLLEAKPNSRYWPSQNQKESTTHATS